MRIVRHVFVEISAYSRIIPEYLTGVLSFQRAGVTFGQAQRAGLEHTPHDLARAGLRQPPHKVDRFGTRDRAHLLADMLAQLFGQRVARLEALAQYDIGVDGLALDLMRQTDRR